MYNVFTVYIHSYAQLSNKIVKLQSQWCQKITGTQTDL